MDALSLLPHVTDALHALQAAGEPLSTLLEGSGSGSEPGLVPAIERLTDLRLLLPVVLDIVLALALASTIAFHPRRRGRAVDIDDVEYPKTVLLYTVVGAVVAEIVVVIPAMALVVFGIGGLLRFRTDVGTAHATGHVILATLVGIACGLRQYPLAVLATAVGWILIATLESGVHYRLVVEKIDRRSIEPSIGLYQELLEREGWSVRGVKREPGKERFSIYARGKSEPSHEPLEDRIPDADPGLRGEPYWEEI